MKNKIILLAIFITSIMGTSLSLKADGSGLDLLWTWNEAKVESFFIDGNKAYIGSYHRFLILEISHKFAPRILAEMPMTAHVRSVCVSGKYAYVVDSSGSLYSSIQPAPNGGLRIIDISSPYHPRQVGFYSNYSPDPAPIFQSIFVSGNLAYIGASFVNYNATSGFLEILDISNPASPKLKGHFDTYFAIHDAQVYGNYAYCKVSSFVSVYPCGGLLLTTYHTPNPPRKNRL